MNKDRAQAFDEALGYLYAGHHIYEHIKQNMKEKFEDYDFEDIVTKLVKSGMAEYDCTKGNNYLNITFLGYGYYINGGYTNSAELFNNSIETLKTSKRNLLMSYVAIIISLITLCLLLIDMSTH